MTKINEKDAGKLSIIIPVYNAEKHLRQCLDSIRQSSYENYEVLMIDDGSMDSSASICDEYRVRDSRFIYYRKENGGVASARNYGLCKATGAYIAFVDNDDIVSPDLYAILIKIIKEKDLDFCACGFAKKYDGYDFIPSKIEYDSEKLMLLQGRDEILENVICDGEDSIEGMIWNKVYKKDFIGTLKFDVDVALVDDAVFSVNLFNKSSRVKGGYYKAEMYFWMQHETNQTNKSAPERYLSATNGFETLLPLVENNTVCYNGIVKQLLGWNYAALSKIYADDKSRYLKELDVIRKRFRRYKRSINTCFDKKTYVKVLIYLYIPIVYDWYESRRLKA